MKILVPEPYGYYAQQKDKRDIDYFVSQQILQQDIRLENQARKVASFTGKLVEFLVNKGLMTPDEFFKLMSLNVQWSDEPLKEEAKYELVKD